MGNSGEPNSSGESLTYRIQYGIRDRATNQVINVKSWEKVEAHRKLVPDCEILFRSVSEWVTLGGE